MNTDPFLSHIVGCAGLEGGECRSAFRPRSQVISGELEWSDHGGQEGSN